MATRVTPYLGGTGQDNTRKLNVHSSLNRVSIGADVLASANLDVFGNTFVRGNVETANTFVSSSNSNTPLQAFVGETAGGRWLNKGGSSAFAWYSDTLVTPVTGFSSLTYYGTTFYPKIVFGSLGDVSVSGKFATNLAQINRDGTASFGSLTVPTLNTVGITGNVYISNGNFATNLAQINRDGTASFGSLTIPALNTVGITGNVYISGNLFVAGNSYQIVSNITQSVGNVVSANAYVVTRLLGLTDIPLSNGITFSNANLVISAYANPSVVFSANNNVWVGSNTAIIGRVASVWTYNPYQLVDDGLVVQHNGGRGNIIQTWIDGRTGTTTRPWSLALTTQGDMAWLVGTAANVKPTIQRMMIDQNGNTLFGTGTVNRANVTITGNTAISTNLTVGTSLAVSTNVFINDSSVYNRANLGGQLTILQPGNLTAGVPFVMTSATSTLRPNGASWGFGINQGGEGRFSIMMNSNLAVQPNVEVISMSRTTSNVDIYANLAVSNSMIISGNLTVVGDFTSTNFNRANTLNEAAVQSACIARGWPIPAFGLIALPEEDPPGNMTYTRAGPAWRFNQYGLLDLVPPNKVRHTYDLDTKEYLGWDYSGTAAKTNPLLWSNNLTITQQLTVTGNTGVFIDGEYVNDGSNTGIYVTGTSTLYGIKGNSARPLLGTVLTGNTSGFTATISASANIWTATNMVTSTNVVGLSGQLGHATYLEATSAGATIEQNPSLSSATRTGVLYLKRLAGTGNINVSWGTTTLLPLLNPKYQDIVFLNSNNFTECRFTGASGVSNNLKITLANAGDKIVVGNMYVSGTDMAFSPIIQGPTSNSLALETMRFAIDTLPPGRDFTFYVKAYTHNPTVTSYITTLSNGASLANMVNFYQSSSILYTRTHNNSAANTASTSTARTMGIIPQEVTLLGKIDQGNLFLYGNDRLQGVNVGNNILLSNTLFDRLTLGRRGDASTTQSGNFIFKEVMVWSGALSNETMRLIGNGSKNSIPRPFIENAGQMRSVIQTLTKLKTTSTGNVSIECAGDSYGAGTAGTASWPYYLAKYFDTQYSNSQAAVGWASGGTNLGPANTNKMSVSYPVGSWTNTLRTTVGPSLGTSTTSTANGYISYNVLTSLGSGIGARLVYIGTSDGQVEYSWNAGVTRYALDLTAAGVGNVGYYDLGNVADSTLRVYRLAGTITIAGVNFTNTNSGVVIHKMCNASGLGKDWYDVNSTQWKTGYEAINPTASIIMLGCYDQAAYYNEDMFALYLQEMIDRRRATVVNRPIMIVMPPDNRRSNVTPMDFYSREARRIAQLNNCTFVDLQYIFGNKVSDYDTSWWSDTIIPNDTEGGPAIISGILQALGAT